MRRHLPYGIQHVFGHVVSNLAPIVIICAAAGLGTDDTAMLIQNAMLRPAGIGTLIQLFGAWRVGAKLPIVYGAQLHFRNRALRRGRNLRPWAPRPGAVIVGGCIEGFLGLFAKYWYNNTSATSCRPWWWSPSGLPAAFHRRRDFCRRVERGRFRFVGKPLFGRPSSLFGACLLFRRFAKGSARQLSTLFGLAFG